jgi:hypothetical protein
MKNRNVLLMALGLITITSLPAVAAGTCFVISTTPIKSNTIITNNSALLSQCNLVGQVVVGAAPRDYSSVLMQVKSSGAGTLYLATLDQKTISAFTAQAPQLGLKAQIISLK